MGCIRSSNLDEGLNFHNRITVQRIIAPPILAPIAIKIVTVVFGKAVAPEVFGNEVCDSCCCVELVTVKVTCCGGVVVAGSVVAAKSSEVTGGGVSITDSDVEVVDVVVLEVEDVEVDVVDVEVLDDVLDVEVVVVPDVVY